MFENVELMQQVAQELITYTPGHFTNIDLEVRPCPRHARGRLVYRIGSPQHPTEGTDRPSAELHEAVIKLVRSWPKGSDPFPGFALRLKGQPDGTFRSSLALADPLPPRDEEALWQATYKARERFFESRFGPLPGDIIKLKNMTGTWPSGGLFEIDALHLGNLGVYTTFGLSNADLPTSCRPVNVQFTADSVSMNLEPRTPRWMPEQAAGYGYELMIVTPGPVDWALVPVSWFVQTEILHDWDLPTRVAKHKGVTIDAIHIGDGTRTADFLVERARAPFPDHLELPNGTAQLLIATRITRDEMEWTFENGRPALSEKLQEAGVGQVSDLTRRSVLT